MGVKKGVSATKKLSAKNEAASAKKGHRAHKAGMKYEQGHKEPPLEKPSKKRSNW